MYEQGNEEVSSLELCVMRGIPMSAVSIMAATSQAHVASATKVLSFNSVCF